MKELIKFSAVGISNTIVSLIVYYCLIALGIDYLMASIIGYFLSSLWGYIMNKVWVFKKKKIVLSKSVLRFYVIYIIALLINIGGLHCLVKYIQLSKAVAPLAVLCITVPFNFLMCKYWVYNS